MRALSNSFGLRSVDFRTALNVSPATFSELLKKNGVYSEKDPPKKGASKVIQPNEARGIFEKRGFSYPKTARVLSFMMCKGGVGKTTSALYLAQRLSTYGAKVLVIDADSQGNLTSALALDRFKFEVDESTPILVDVLTGAATIEEAIVAVTPTFHIIPSNPLNATLEGKIREAFKNPSLPIKRAIEPLLSRYEFIIFDCAPALNLTNTAIISASHQVILPVSPDKFSQLGLNQTLKEIDQIEKDFNVSLDKKIIFTKFDAREFTSLKYLADIANEHSDKRFQTAIRTCADVKNAITKREDLFSMKKSAARADYDAFAKEILGLDRAFKAQV